MKKLMMLPVLVVLFLAAIVFAQPIPVEPPAGGEVGWALSTLMWVVERFKAKEYMPAVGAVIVVLTFAVRRFVLPNVDAKVMAFVAALLGAVLAAGTNLLAMAVGAKPMDWLSAVAMGFVTGGSASGLWSMVGKWALEKIFPPKPVAVPGG